MSRGRVFQMVGAATAKLREPKRVDTQSTSVCKQAGWPSLKQVVYKPNQAVGWVWTGNLGDRVDLIGSVNPADWQTLWHAYSSALHCWQTRMPSPMGSVQPRRDTDPLPLTPNTDRQRDRHRVTYSSASHSIQTWCCGLHAITHGKCSRRHLKNSTRWWAQ